MEWGAAAARPARLPRGKELHHNMPTGDSNGNSASRLDRIERIVEVIANTQHDQQADIRMLTTSQVLMTESINKLTANMHQLAEAQKHTDQRLAAAITELDQKIAQVTENLGILILTVDEIIRGKKPGAEAET